MKKEKKRKEKSRVTYIIREVYYLKRKEEMRAKHHYQSHALHYRSFHFHIFITRLHTRTPRSLSWTKQQSLIISSIQRAVSTEKQRLSTASDPQFIFLHNTFLCQQLNTLSHFDHSTRHGSTLTHSLSSTPPRVNASPSLSSLAKPKP